MEQARFFIAIVLSILVFVLWDLFFVPKTPLQQQTTETEQTDNINQQQQPAASINVAGNKPDITPQEFTPTIPDRDPRIITVETDLYIARISEKGAKLISLELKNYKETLDGPELKEMVSPLAEEGTLELSLLNKSISGLNNAFFEAQTDEDILSVKDKSEISFSWVSPQGIKIVKKYIFSPDNYVFNYNIILENGSKNTLDDSLKLTLINSLPMKRGYAFEGPCAYIDNKLQEVKVKEIEEKSIYSGNLEWIAIQNRYFISAIIPSDNTHTSMHLKHEVFQSAAHPENNGHDLIRTNLVQMMDPINPGYSKKYQFGVYVGPKSVQILKESGYNLDKAVNFGWFDFIAKPCLYLMNKLYEFIPNYGIAIIVITILVKILFWPLGSKSYRSMNEMKKIQPLMAEIREKYKGNPQEMNKEMMALYKTYKVNPVGGCLPMVAQIPIFFAFYRMLYSAIELRHAPFFGWITDLSAPDRLFDFGIVLPFFQPPTGIPVLTLIMGASMFLQQKMAPPAGDPQQQKLMMLMPVFMTLIFINFSSGLVLYWLVNNILSITQQYIITKQSEK